MTTSKGHPLTANQNAAIVALKAVQQIEENNKFANGQLWNNIQDQIDDIEEAARQTYINGEDKGYIPILCDQFHNA
jgi:competence protein ComGF